MLLMPLKQHPKQTAAACYAERYAEASELVKRIADELNRHRSLQAGNPGSWADAGDLGRVTEQLAYVLASLGDRSAVEAKGLSY